MSPISSSELSNFLFIISLVAYCLFLDLINVTKIEYNKFLDHFLIFEDFKKMIFVVKPEPGDEEKRVELKFSQPSIQLKDGFEFTKNFKIFEKNLLISINNGSLLLVLNYNDKQSEGLKTYSIPN